ncbi:hypothetical protein PARPLA_02075 [Rhodobacteraceae bacterium THAF1]|uniref:DUF2125 domain-containing protein n=1 Tax=Palleronia sp. THAF1 TaxID=2587842 RepID=UPI000F3F021A|nr:DUF2125 domain-containing protein [Palleronia sp. THAF1]QFU07788.1 hypothetical protein FIU81_03775 [Palleronia sp. THAF1]VDC25603.1 hypothetical protein PARPLA_02075 [Rhodobacteraceae bacterium THAF1]
MRWLIGLIVVAALGWSAYWFIGATALERALTDSIDAARSEGVEVQTEALNVTGFPNRFDTMIDELEVHVPASGLTWSLPFLQIFALSYRPNQVIVALPPSQRLTGPFGEATLTTESARGSATVSPSTDLTLDHANLVVDDAVLSSNGVDLSALRILAASRLAPGDDSGRAHNIGITLDDVRLPPALADRLGGPDSGLIDGATLDATVTFDRPVDLAVYQGAPLEVQVLEIADLKIDWGEIGLDAAGDLNVGADGFVTGTLETTLRNWQGALQIAAQAGLFPQDNLRQVEQALGLVAMMSGGDGRLTLPLEFRNGQTFLGPVALGPAPRL